MNAVDYIPSVLAFAFALLGILTRTKNDTKVGFRKVTRGGWMFLLLSVVSLLFGLFTINSSHVTAQKRQVVANMVRITLSDSIATLIRPLCGSGLDSELQPSALFKLLVSEDNLREVGQDRTVKWITEGRIIARPTLLTPAMPFDEPYELYDHYISSGQNSLMQSLSLFGQYLTEEEIIAVLTLLSDPFLNLDYRLEHRSDYFEQGRMDETMTREPSPWNTRGLHYFNAIYEGPSTRAGDYQRVSDFLRKAEGAVNAIRRQHGNAPSFQPCIVTTELQMPLKSAEERGE